MHIVDMVSFWARTMPRRAAIIQPDGVITYRALAHAIESAAEHFARNIPDKSKPVAVALDHAPGMLAACLGLLRAGYSIVPATKPLFEYLGNVGVNTLVHERGGAPLPGGSNILFNASWLSTGVGAAALARLPRYTQTPPRDTIFFTSGTTGKPKHFVMTQSAWDERMLLPSTTTFANFERALIVPGLASAYGFTRTYETLYLGKTACFARFGEPALWLVNTYDIDMIVASTQQALSLADMQAKTSRYPLSAVKTLKRRQQRIPLQFVIVARTVRSIEGASSSASSRAIAVSGASPSMAPANARAAASAGSCAPCGHLASASSHTRRASACFPCLT
jgi:hypothetical protein